MQLELPLKLPPQRSLSEWDLENAGCYDPSWNRKDHSVTNARTHPVTECPDSDRSASIDVTECTDGHHSVTKPGNAVTECPDDAYEFTFSRGAVSIYEPGGSACGHSEYYRYSYRDRGRLKHRHIPGGNTSNPIAQRNADRVREMIRQGRAIGEILQAIAHW